MYIISGTFPFVIPFVSFLIEKNLELLQSLHILPRILDLICFVVAEQYCSRLTVLLGSALCMKTGRGQTRRPTTPGTNPEIMESARNDQSLTFSGGGCCIL